MSGTLTAKPIVVYRVLRHGVEVNETDSLICNNSNRTLHLKNQSAIFFYSKCKRVRDASLRPLRQKEPFWLLVSKVFNRIR